MTILAFEQGGRALRLSKLSTFVALTLGSDCLGMFDQLSEALEQFHELAAQLKVASCLPS